MRIVVSFISGSRWGSSVSFTTLFFTTLILTNSAGNIQWWPMLLKLEAFKWGTCTRCHKKPCCLSTKEEQSSTSLSAEGTVEGANNLTDRVEQGSSNHLPHRSSWLCLNQIWKGSHASFHPLNSKWWWAAGAAGAQLNLRIGCLSRAFFSILICSPFPQLFPEAGWCRRALRARGALNPTPYSDLQ